MLYEPLPGSAAIILTQLGIIEQGQVGALGARTYDSESARLSLALDDGRTVELERAMHLHTENGYAVRIRSRAGQTISRSFIHIDRDLGVRNLYNDRMVYIDDADLTHASEAEEREPSEAEIEADADYAHEAQLHESQTYPLQPEAVPHQAQPEPVVTPLEVSAASPGEEQGIVNPHVSEPEPHVDWHEATLPEPAGVEEEAFEPPTEMLEILPEADIATIIYFHETLSPESEQAASAPSALPAIARPQASEAIAGDPAREPATQAAISAGTSSPETEVVSEAVPVPAVQAAAEFAVQEPAVQELASTDAASTAAAAVESASSTENSPAVENPDLSASTRSQAAESSAAATPEPFEAEAAASDRTEAEADPEYLPLNTALTPAEAADFTFVAQTGTIHTYEHRQTFRYIHIDAPSGLFYDQTRTPISRAAALKRALTPAPIAAPATEEDASTSSPELQTPDPMELQSVASAASTGPVHPPEPELRTRRIPAARAAVTPEPTAEAVAQDANHGLSLDAFTRKHGSPLERQSLRNRIGELGRVFRLGRNQNGSNGNQDS